MSFECRERLSRPRPPPLRSPGYRRSRWDVFKHHRRNRLGVRSPSSSPTVALGQLSDLQAPRQATSLRSPRVVCRTRAATLAGLRTGSAAAGPWPLRGVQDVTGLLRAALRGGRMVRAGRGSQPTSAASVTRMAPRSRMYPWHPADTMDVTGAWHAASTRWCWARARGAERPDRSPASTTRVPWVAVAMMRFLLRKRCFVGALPGGTSDTTRPTSAIRSISCRCATGYGRSTPRPGQHRRAVHGQRPPVGRRVDAERCPGDHREPAIAEAGGEVTGRGLSVGRRAPRPHDCPG